MAIDDPYDRSGQYAGGDTGQKLDNYSPLAPDRRDHAVATLVGDGGPDSKKGYAGVLDTIENRIGAAQRFGGTGEFGYYGHGLKQDSTLEGVVTARNRENGGAYQFSNWSPHNRASYDMTQRALAGKPRADEQGWYDQAQEVYDDYYHDPEKGYRGIAQGATYYQNDGALSARNAGFQRDMRRDYGALSLGLGLHAFTGPGYYGDGLQAYEPMPMEAPLPPSRGPGLAQQLQGFSGLDDYSGVYDDRLEPDYEGLQGFAGVNDFSGVYGDRLQNVASWGDDPMQPEAYGYATPTEPMIGEDGSWLGGLGGLASSDRLHGVAGWSDDPMQPDAYDMPPSAVTGYADDGFAGIAIDDRLQQAPAWRDDPMMAGQYGRPQQLGQALADPALQGGTGNETSQRPDGTVADHAGAYGGHDAFGPNDPFGGVGFGGSSVADVADSFEADVGQGDFDSGWSDGGPDPEGFGGGWW